MHRRRAFLTLLAILLATLSLNLRQITFSNAARAQVRIPAPEDVLGFAPVRIANSQVGPKLLSTFVSLPPPVIA